MVRPRAAAASASKNHVRCCHARVVRTRPSAAAFADVATTLSGAASGLTTRRAVPVPVLVCCQTSPPCSWAALLAPAPVVLTSTAPEG